MFNKKVNLFGNLNDQEFRYIQHYTEQERLKKHEEMSIRFDNNRVLVVVENHKYSKLRIIDKSLQYILNESFCVEKTKNLLEFINVLRKTIQLAPTQTLFLYCNNSLMIGYATIGELYDKFKSKDQHLYLKYADFDTFG